MTPYEMGYLFGRLVCPLIVLALIVGAIVYTVVRALRRSAPPRPPQGWQQYPGQPYPQQGWQPPQPGPPYGGQSYPGPAQPGQAQPGQPFPPVGPQPPYSGQ